MPDAVGREASPLASAAASRRTGRHLDGTALALAVAAWILNPYSFAVSDHTYKIPFLKAAADPSLYARDMTVQMRTAYASLFSWLALPLASLAGVPVAFFVIHGLTLIAFFLLAARLGAALTGERATGWFAILLLFFPQVVAGGIATFDVILEERLIAFVLVLASLLMLTRGRDVAAGLLAGLAGDLHLVTLANFLVAAGCLFGVALARPQPRRATVSRAGRFVAAMAAAALPLLVLRLRSGSASLFTRVDPEWLRMILLRSPNHFLPDDGLLVGHALLGAALLVLTWRWQADRRLRAVLAAAWLGMIAGFALATLFATRLPWLAGLQLCLYRTDQLFLVVAAVATAWCFARASVARPWVGLLALVAFSFLAFRDRLVLLCALALVSLVMPPRRVAAEDARPRLGGWAMVAGLALFLGVAIARGHRPHWDNPLRPIEGPNIEVQRWLRAHTDRDALVLAPPGDTDFRIFSERAVLGSWKDWTYNVLSRDFAFAMYERLQDVGGLSLAACSSGVNCERRCVEHYARLSERDLLTLAAKYGVDFVVRPASAPLAWPPVFENAGYRVYPVAPHASSDSRPRRSPIHGYRPAAWPRR